VTTIASLSGLQTAAMLLDRTAAGQGAPDLAGQVTDLMRATVAINAGAAAVRTSDETQQSLIDVLA
jgi:hypothetical protein